MIPHKAGRLPDHYNIAPSQKIPANRLIVRCPELKMFDHRPLAPHNPGRKDLLKVIVARVCG